MGRVWNRQAYKIASNHTYTHLLGERICMVLPYWFGLWAVTVLHFTEEDKKTQLGMFGIPFPRLLCPLSIYLKKKSYPEVRLKTNRVLC